MANGIAAGQVGRGAGRGAVEFFAESRVQPVVAVQEGDIFAACCFEALVAGRTRTGVDQRFREKMETIVAQRLGDADFNVDTLASLLKMGRTKFYGKMKECTGMSPNSYLQNERLKRAAELLIEGDLNVTEVSYKVGFQSPTYFYKCFKEKYGVPPSKFGKSK